MTDLDVQVGNPQILYLLGPVIAVLLLCAFSVVSGLRAARKFSSSNFHNSLLSQFGAIRKWLSAVLIAASMLFLLLALMDIRWGKAWVEVPQKGIEVMFVLDVSRSMLAEDAVPNRLSRAKQQIKDMISEMQGDRIGLVVFAGEAKQAVPLTSHYEDFKQSLDTVGPQTVNRGGSRLGDAIKAAVNGFMSKTNNHKAIVIFTDGEDQESQPVEIARQIDDENGIRIFAVGLGDMDQGSRIPDSESRRGGFVKHDGQQVWSKLNGEILGQIALETHGAYIPAGTKQVNMADVYHRFVATVDQTEFETAKINAYVARFQQFAVLSLFLLLVEVWISTRNANNATKHVGQVAAGSRAIAADTNPKTISEHAA